jgi:endonuclease/exonuclease/phosphatase (EEP) superfamily protein YafD
VAHRDTEKTSGFRIVSANLRNGGADPHAFAALIAELRADAVAVQELAPAQADALARVIPHGQLYPATDYNGMGIALRSAATVRRLSMPYRDAYSADLQLTANGGASVAVELINVHMQAPHSRPTWATVRHRRGQLRGLERHLTSAAAEFPRVVVGDFNASPIWPLYRRIAGQLRDAALIAAARNGGRTRPTWGPGTYAPRMLRIDHAFVHRVEVLAFHVVPVRGSDHRAVVVDVGPAA